MRKRTCLLVAIFISICIWNGLERLISSGKGEIYRNGELSEIAKDVVAIPLESIAGTPIKDVRDLYKEGDNLFLISRDILYRFNRKGEFICRITNPKEIRVAGYMVDEVKQQLIVLGNVNDIYYYDYEGNLLSKKKLKRDFGKQQLLSAILYRNKIYTIEQEQVNIAEKKQKVSIKCHIGVYDTAFHELEKRNLKEAELTHPTYVSKIQNLNLHVNPDTGEVYACSFPYQPDYLLSDTLYLSHISLKKQPDEVPLYPIQMGSRFWFAFNRHADDESKRYTYCWDRHENQAWQTGRGFKDDFYQSGYVTELLPMGVSGDQYFYCKNGEEVSRSFPEATDSTVVFIVNLKG